jgi:protein-S-isoprenylcysteine O-methyltransferase Ste14
VSQIIELAGILLMNFSWISIAAWVGLLIVLERKSSLEERLLKERSGDYERYSMKTKRFLPFIF